MIRRLLALLAAALIGGCQQADTGSAASPSAPRADATGALTPVTQASSGSSVELGRKIYNFRCYYCHGYSGDAKTLASTFLNPGPRDFTATSAEELTREKILDVLEKGRPGTAMKGFAGILARPEMEAVAAFVRNEFVLAKRKNTQYHTEANGWPNHEKYAAAFPFATGAFPLDTPWEKLTPEQQAGKRLFLSACVSCHDRAKVINEGKVWDLRPLSYPRNNYSNSNPEVDAMASASPYAIHDRPPRIAGLNGLEHEGERLYQENCAFCHAADGTARNWIGRFLEPHPRDLTSPDAMGSMTRARLHNVIREGLPGTSMPAWKSVLSEQQIQAIIAYLSRAFHRLPDG